VGRGNLFEAYYLARDPFYLVILALSLYYGGIWYVWLADSLAEKAGNVGTKPEAVLGTE
jgi:hypothetical protein